MAEPINFTVRIEEFGWAFLDIEVGARRLTVTCSYISDSLAHLVRTFLHLASEEDTVDVPCHEEPGEFTLRLRRVADRFYLSVIFFSWPGETVPEALMMDAMRGVEGAWDKVYATRSKQPELEYEGLFAQALNNFASAFERAVQPIGTDKYAEYWFHPFPQGSWDALQRVRNAEG